MTGSKLPKGRAGAKGLVPEEKTETKAAVFKPAAMDDAALLEEQKELVRALSEINAEIGQRTAERKQKALEARCAQVNAFINLSYEAFEKALDFFAPEHQYPTCKDSDPTDDVHYHDERLPAVCTRCRLIYAKKYGYLSYAAFSPITMYTEAK